MSGKNEPRLLAERDYHSFVIRALLTLLLLLATSLQPVLAVPLRCSLTGERSRSVCSPCCANKVCCTISKQAESTRIPIAATTEKDGIAALPPMLSGPAIWLDVASTYYIRRLLAPLAHAPPRLAISCIQLI